MIAVFLSPLYLLLNGYLAWRTLGWLLTLNGFFGSLFFIVPFLACFLFLCTSPLAAFWLRGAPRDGARRVSGLWLGVLMYLLLFMLASELVWILSRAFLGQSLLQSRDPAFVRVSGIAVAAGVLSVSLYGVRHASRLRVVSFQTVIDKPSSLSHLRIALAADLHLGCTVDVRLIEKMVDAINAAKPDLIVFAGDLFDNDFDTVRRPDAIIRSLRRLDSTYGAWACWGNHDMAEKILAGFTFSCGSSPVHPDPRMARFLSDAGIHLLEDETVQFGRAFTLTGRLDRSWPEKTGERRKTPAELAAGIDLSLPAIVADHQPAELEALVGAGFDLDLSGHTHDGQVFPSLIFTRLGWKNSYGLKKFGAMTSVVTSGAGVWGPAMRVGTHNEVAVIDLRFRNGA